MNATAPKEARFSDTLSGARACLVEISTLRGASKARGRRDPAVEGVWKLEAPWWEAIVYLAGYHDPYGNRRTTNDFEACEK